MLPGACFSLIPTAFICHLTASSSCPREVNMFPIFPHIPATSMLPDACFFCDLNGLLKAISQ